MRIGTTEIVMILIVVLIIFGPKNLPKLGKMFGQTMKGFKEGIDDDDDDTTKKSETKNDTTKNDGAEVMGDDGSMTLSGHLRELRNRIVICAVIYIVAAVGFLAIADQLINFLTAMADGVYNFISIDPQEKLIQYFRVALLAALVVTVPFIAYHVYAFAKPGLKKSESFFFGLVLVMGLGLFVVGVLFAYFISLPFMLNFMGTLAGADYIVQTTSIASYISFCITIFLIFGAVFEMPLVVIILARMGIVSPQLMKKARGVMIVPMADEDEEEEEADEED